MSRMVALQLQMQRIVIHIKGAKNCNWIAILTKSQTQDFKALGFKEVAEAADEE